MPDKDPKKTEFKVATGIDDEEELNASATQEEIQRGEYTRVTRLALDENDPS